MISSTIRIENEWKETGTGFLIHRITDGNDKGRLFLVTNKHVLNPQKSKRDSATYIKLHLNLKIDGDVKGNTVQLNMKEKIWEEHPDEDVDVLVFDITSLVEDLPSIEYGNFTYDLFIDKQKIEELPITIGDEIIAMGYPSLRGLKHLTTNFPFLRQGIISSKIGELLEDIVEHNGISRKRILRGFMIDGAVIPGSSGSPVILKPILTRQKNGNISIGEIPPFLLGIVAETRYSEIITKNSDFLSYANMGLVFNADVIKETIELFF